MWSLPVRRVSQLGQTQTLGWVRGSECARREGGLVQVVVQVAHFLQHEA